MAAPASKALEAFADNLGRLMKARALSSPQQVVNVLPASAKKISQKTIKRILLRENEPTLETVEAIAKVFGLEAWQMLIPGLQPSERPEMKRAVTMEPAGA
jgi:transcriptional regulator with XRE-family HTH domain